MTTFRQLLEQFEESAKTRTAKGRRFERFCEAYFKTDPLWTERFERVWMWEDWPGRAGRSDTGIDLVAEEVGTGKLVAIQCKFYSPDAVLDWRHLSTFIGMLGQPDFASGMVVSTAGAESSKVHSNISHLEKKVTIWRVDDFEASRVDWDQFSIEQPTQLVLRDPKALRPHQEKAIGQVREGFDLHARGQLIMACGTGKTFTSLRLAEQMVGPGGSVLFLVPSINLLSQAVLAWAEDAVVPLSTFAVCSDSKAGKRSDEDMSVNDLAFPASTNTDQLLEGVEARSGPGSMTVIFSTYQSIDVITEAHDKGLGEFDLVICDEAHRTTGAFKEDGSDSRSVFTKVHDDKYVQAAHRLYMTATPRVYGDQSKQKARQDNVIVASMDDETTFGPEFHRLEFGEAVAQKLLTDYKVIVLAVNEDTISGSFQKQLADSNLELALDDAAKIVGCWHGLSKRGPQFDGDDIPMKRAVAFSSTIKQSQAFTDAFPEVVNAALADRSDPNAVKIETEHVDGRTNVQVRSQAINWLEESPGQRVCRVLSNAKCLTEGVDVPALDAVLFLQSRKSIVDVVQAVGRVMRLSPGKEFGYVILPIGIPAGVPAEQALRDNKRYQVVWQVLQALRSHDERLAAEINKIDINKGSGKIQVIGIGADGGDDPTRPGEPADQLTLDLPDLGEWRDALYARIVEKVGDRKYMDTWAADISKIAAAQETRIRGLLDHPEQNPAAVARFDEFHQALRNNLNDGITRDDAIGMLSQHLITRPVFDALFGGDEFTRHNPVSQVMQGMLDELDNTNVQSETATLEGFYNHIQMLIGGIDSADGRQRVITELYEKFFKKALPKTADALGIVYTPLEIVDFIIRSVNDLLVKHFDGTTLSDEGVHILDPFTGTGTFIARLIQSGLIRPEDIERKYRNELHANELTLLAYYIAAINIETVYQRHVHGDTDGEYVPFEGIVLTDTFQLSEEGDPMDHLIFPNNNARAERQKNLTDIRVILGNPPYSVGQSSQNDDNQNLIYPTLDGSIRDTYAARSTASNKNKLYDSYIRALRWASNRLQGSPDGGVVGFVTNGGWIDGNSTDGIRHTLVDEYQHIYIYNLRGNSRTAGEQRKREGDGVFDQGSRNTVAITFLVRTSELPAPTSGKVYYRDIGDYLDRSAKLNLVAESSVDTLPWRSIVPNESADWVTQRDERYETMYPLSDHSDALFGVRTNGIITGRDAWVISSSRVRLNDQSRRMTDFFNSQVDKYHKQAAIGRQEMDPRDVVDKDPAQFSWNDEDFRSVVRGKRLAIHQDVVQRAAYRPFFSQYVLLEPQLLSRVYQIPQVFPPGKSNVGIAIVAPGSKSPFGVYATSNVPAFHLINSDITSYLARWRYEPPDGEGTLMADILTRPTSNLNPRAVARFSSAVGEEVDDDAVFFYVYGVLHSPEFRSTFEANLKKEAPRVPLPDDRAMFDAFGDAGRELFGLHANFEDVDPFPVVEEWAAGADPDTNPDLLLVSNRKMRYPQIPDPDQPGKKIKDRTRLIYNEHLTLTGIPLRAHDYVLGTRSGIDWIIDRWYVKTDKASGIVNDVNQWGLEQGQPRYIIDLIKKVVALSLRTVEIVEGLPKLTF